MKTAIHRLWTRLPRPLDPLRSIKIKLGVVVAATVAVAVAIVQIGLYAGYPARYTMPVCVLISLVVIQILAHGMTAPLREMTAAARAMARGDYTRRVRDTSRDEVGELARAFNRMATDLAEVDRQRREFVANVSHELRTPISALRAVLENAADGVTPATPEALEMAVRQTDRLSRLITQLLDLSRVDAGAAFLDLQAFEVRPFLGAVVAEIETGHGDVDFRLDAPADMKVVADRDRLHQVVANLLDNAARHSPAGGTVEVTARPRADGLLLEVADEGPGIPAAERGRVFERFSRGTRSPDGGTGLGLAIAQWVVDLHDGEIGVVDAARGCRIRVLIPEYLEAPDDR